MSRTKTLLQVGAKFGKVSVGDETTSVGMHFQYDAISEDADEAMVEGIRFFRNRQITVKLVRKRNGEANGQQHLPGLNDAELEFLGIATTGRLSLGSKDGSCTLSFPLNGENGVPLTKFAARPVDLIITDVIDAIEDEPEPAEGQRTFDSHEDTGPIPRAPESSAVPAASNGSNGSGKKSRGKKSPPASDKAQYVESPTGKTAFDKSSVAPDGMDLAEIVNARERAKKPPSPEYSVGFKSGCEGALTGKDLQCPTKYKADKAQGWQDGYLITRVEK